MPQRVLAEREKLTIFAQSLLWQQLYAVYFCAVSLPYIPQCIFQVARKLGSVAQRGRKQAGAQG